MNLNVNYESNQKLTTRIIAAEAVIGASSNVATTYTVNNYYQDADHQDSMVTQGIKGAGFGAAVKDYEERKLLFWLYDRALRK